MTLTWKDGKSIDQLIPEIYNRRDYILEQCEKALSLSVELGAVELQDFLEKATTKTGAAREAKGGFPGRHRSGNMIASISHNGDNLEHSGNVITGSFGWFANYFEQYFRDQDDVNSLGIPPAFALMNAASMAQAQFQKYMTQIVRGEAIGSAA